jgi:hypothetical protein
VVDLSWRRDEDGKAQWYMSWSMQSTAGIEQDQAILDIVSKYEEETEKNIDVDLDEILLRLTGIILRFSCFFRAEILPYNQFS